MKRRFFRSGLTPAVLMAAGLVVTAGVEAQHAVQKSSVATPRTPDGKPDLSGMWRRPRENTGGGLTEEQRARGIAYASRRCAPNQKGCRENTNQNVDQEFTNRVNPNKPLYKPEYWDKVQWLDYDTNNTDPMLKCLPLGVPRMGPPTKIVQTPKEMIFLYTKNLMSEVRVIPTDGRGHDPERSQDISWYGDAIGIWEGDTLVVDSIGFNDVTWLDSEKGQNGYFHSEKMRVIERFRREGNDLHYEVTIEDPEVLLQPWTKDPQVLTLDPSPKATLYEGDVCRDYETGVAVWRIRH